MQNISIKAGTSATIYISPKIGDTSATATELSGITIYVFFVYQFTNKIYKEYKLTADSNYSTTNKLAIKLTPADTIGMLGNAAENQRFEVQFAIKDSNGNVVAKENDSEIVINVERWEAGTWLHQQK